MSIDAVFPTIGGIGIRLTGTVVRFAAIEGRSVGAGVAPTGRLACAGPVSTVCEAHGVGLGDAVAAGTDAAATVGDAVVLGVLQAIASAATLMNVKTGRTEERITAPPSRCAAAKIPHAARRCRYPGGSHRERALRIAPTPPHIAPATHPNTVPTGTLSSDFPKRTKVKPPAKPLTTPATALANTALRICPERRSARAPVIAYPRSGTRTETARSGTSGTHESSGVRPTNPSRTTKAESAIPARTPRATVIVGR